MAAALFAAILAALQGLWLPMGWLGPVHAPALAALGNNPASPLETRLAQWPAWRLPAPLPRPGHGELIYPDWFEGDWLLRSEPWPEERAAPTIEPAAGQAGERFEAPLRFRRDGRGAVLGERAANAAAVGRAVLGEALLEVRDDPGDPNHQQARLQGGQWLDSTVIGRATAQPEPNIFLADELALQVLHSEGPPRISRVETLSRYHHRSGEGRIEGEQWQVRHPGPGESGNGPRSSGHYRLELKRRS